VLRDRRALAADGMFLVVVTVDKQTGNIIGRPEIVTAASSTGTSRTPSSRRPSGGDGLDRESGQPHQRGGAPQVEIKDGVSRYLYEQTKRRPMVFPVVVEV